MRRCFAISIFTTCCLSLVAIPGLFSCPQPIRKCQTHRIRAGLRALAVLRKHLCPCPRLEDTTVRLVLLPVGAAACKDDRPSCVCQEGSACFHCAERMPAASPPVKPLITHACLPPAHL